MSPSNPDQTPTQKISRRSVLKAIAAMPVAYVAGTTIGNFIGTKLHTAVMNNDERNIEATTVAGSENPKKLEEIMAEFPLFLRQTAVQIDIPGIVQASGIIGLGLASGIIIENNSERITILTARHIIEMYEDSEPKKIIIQQPQNNRGYIAEYGGPDNPRQIKVAKDESQDLGMFIIEASDPIPAISDQEAPIIMSYEPNPNEDLYTISFPSASSTVKGGYYPDKFRLSPISFVTVAAGKGYTINAKITPGGSGSPVANKNGLVGILVTYEPGIANQFLPIGDAYDRLISQISPR